MPPPPTRGTRAFAQAGVRKKEAEGDLDEASKKGTGCKNWSRPRRGRQRPMVSLGPTLHAQPPGPESTSHRGKATMAGSDRWVHPLAKDLDLHRSLHTCHNLVARTTKVVVQHSRSPLAVEPAPPTHPRPPSRHPPTTSISTNIANSPYTTLEQRTSTTMTTTREGACSGRTRQNQIHPGVNPKSPTNAAAGAGAAHPGRAEGPQPLASLPPAKARATGRHQHRSGREASMAARQGLDPRLLPKHGKDDDHHGRRRSS